MQFSDEIAQKLNRGRRLTENMTRGNVQRLPKQAFPLATNSGAYSISLGRVQKRPYGFRVGWG
jgi:hypothetical protein